MKPYLKAIIILVVYVLFTRGLFVAMILFPNTLVALSLETLSATLFGIAWLYFFDHEHAFRFIQIIKEKNKNKEQMLLDKFLRFGSIGAVIIIGYIAGPLFCSLTTFILLNNLKYKYILVILVCASSSFLALAIARGILSLAFKLS